MFALGRNQAFQLVLIINLAKGHGQEGRLTLSHAEEMGRIISPFMRHCTFPPQNPCSECRNLRLLSPAYFSELFRKAQVFLSTSFLVCFPSCFGPPQHFELLILSVKTLSLPCDCLLATLLIAHKASHCPLLFLFSSSSFSQKLLIFKGCLLRYFSFQL